MLLEDTKVFRSKFPAVCKTFTTPRVNHALCGEMGLLPRGLEITRQRDLVKGAQALAPAVLSFRFWMLGVEKT